MLKYVEEIEVEEAN
jgi:hypothetical protein